MRDIFAERAEHRVSRRNPLTQTTKLPGQIHCGDETGRYVADVTFNASELSSEIKPDPGYEIALWDATGRAHSGRYCDASVPVRMNSAFSKPGIKRRMFFC